MELDLGSILTIVLGVVTTFAGGFWLKAKSKLGSIGKLIKEFYDLVDAFNSALEDDKISKKELEKIKGEFLELKAVFKDMFQKE